MLKTPPLLVKTLYQIQHTGINDGSEDSNTFLGINLKSQSVVVLAYLVLSPMCHELRA